MVYTRVCVISGIIIWEWTNIMEAYPYKPPALWRYAYEVKVYMKVLSGMRIGIWANFIARHGGKLNILVLEPFLLITNEDIAFHSTENHSRLPPRRAVTDRWRGIGRGVTSVPPSGVSATLRCGLSWIGDQVSQLAYRYSEKVTLQTCRFAVECMTKWVFQQTKRGLIGLFVKYQLNNSGCKAQSMPWHERKRGRRLVLPYL